MARKCDLLLNTLIINLGKQEMDELFNFLFLFQNLTLHYPVRNRYINGNVHPPAKPRAKGQPDCSKKIDDKTRLALAYQKKSKRASLSEQCWNPGSPSPPPIFIAECAYAARSTVSGRNASSKKAMQTKPSSTSYVAGAAGLPPGAKTLGAWWALRGSFGDDSTSFKLIERRLEKRSGEVFPRF